ncbi:unnamed protein product [Lymnaea stagnalis]|uniref:Beta-1,4-galactosyltransferase n=1 Tax=Lymnaea stagnalis TaxID=6523 RepID=A0AAV2GZB7_LYMST
MTSKSCVLNRCKPRPSRVTKLMAILFITATLILVVHMTFSYSVFKKHRHREVPITLISQSTVQVRNITQNFVKTSSMLVDDVFVKEPILGNAFTRHQIISCDAREEFSTDSKNRTFNPRINKTCPGRPPTLAGRFAPSTNLYTYHELAAMFPDVQDGGHYTPRTCMPAEKTAIIIPYRNRCRHLYTLLPNLIPMLMRQNVDFTIFVIEQSTLGSFNKGILFNAGYLEALKVDNYDCFILQDVDMIPIDDRNMYRCNKTGPVHFSPRVNKFKYKLHYSGLFGGVVGFTTEQFRLINGASNLYFGWGGEDDDLRNRAVNRKLPLLRKNFAYGIYDMVNHTGVKEEGWKVNPDRLKIYRTGRLRQHVDGLNSLVYNLTWVRTSALYTWIGIGFNATYITKTVPKQLRIGRRGDLSYLKANFTIIS